MKTKEKILIAATEEFASKGYLATTTRDICRKVNMNTAAANYHFNTKQELYCQVFKYLFTEIKSNAGNSKNSIIQSDNLNSSIEIWILSFLFALLDKTATSRWKALLIAREMTNPSEVFPWLFKNYFKPIILNLKEQLEEIFQDKDQQEIMLEVFSILSQCLFYVQNRSVVEATFGKNFYTKAKLTEIATLIYEGLIIKARYSIKIKEGEK